MTGMNAVDFDVKQQLIDRIRNREARIAVIGVGYVGLPLITALCEVGFQAIGIDVDESKVSVLCNGKSPIAHISSEKIKSFLDKGRCAFSCDFSEVFNSDVIVLCVPTPLGKHREPDLSFVKGAGEAIRPFLRVGQLISLESTTYPGTTDTELKEILESSGCRVGRDIFLVYSPEREDPGNTEFSTSTIPKVCGGVTEDCLAVGLTFYQTVVSKVVPVSSARAAEMTKLLENIHRAVNIGLVNEMKVVADKMGLDIFEVIDAAATKPFGFVRYTPGPGLGGHCIPIDPFYLTWKAKEFEVNTRFIELAGEINSSMPHYVIDKIVKALNDRSKPVRGSKLLILGLAYKKNVGDLRESPSIEIIDKLISMGAELRVVDPHVSTRDFESLGLKAEFVPEICNQSLSSADCVVVVTDHDAFDYGLIRSASSLVVDTRGRLSWREPNVVRA